MFFCAEIKSRARTRNFVSAFGGCLQTLALCTVCNFADTLRRFAVYPRFALCRAALLNPLFEYIRTDDRCAYTSECEYKRTRSAFGGCLQTLALCTVSNFADTLRRFAVYPRFALCRAALLNPTENCQMKCNALYVIASVAWQSPGRVTLL